MRTTPEGKLMQYRIIYEKFTACPRVKVRDVSSLLRVNRHCASLKIREAFNLGFVLAPQLRKRSYVNMKEYMYFVNCMHPFNLYKEYSKDLNVVYHARMVGFANMWIVANRKMDVEGKTVVEGFRSDYYVAHAPNHSWQKAVDVMWKKVKGFDPDTYQPKGFIVNHSNESIHWDSQDEILFQEFKYDLRRNLSPIMKEHGISARKIYSFFDKMHRCCSVFTRFFPETILSYDLYLFMFETEYEDFVIELVSELPTSPFFFKIRDTLFMYTNVDKSFSRRVGLDMSDVSQLHIPLLVDALIKKGIVKREDHAIAEYSNAKGF
ncbi:MAG: hypothetical protein WBA22_08565 [Candidatus Methanofastidiosia archaeon]